MKMDKPFYNLDSLFPSEPDFFKEEEMRLSDYEYLKRLYPRELRLISTILEEYMDQYEYEGSPMYVQYPDAVTIYRIADNIYNKLSFVGSEQEIQKMKNMLQMMVCQEMYVRRRRHDRFCRTFQNHMKRI